MPTYLCYAAVRRLSTEQKARIALAITNAHCEETGAPRYLAQVIFHELSTTQHYVAGIPAASNQMWIHGDIRAGRTERQKNQLLIRLAKEVGEIAGSCPDEVWVYLNELQPGNMLEFGDTLPQPGEEKNWFMSLPPALHEKLKRFEEASRD